MDICSVRIVNDNEVPYTAFTFICPGCAQFGYSGLHILPVNSEHKRPNWEFNNDLIHPTLSPSILSGSGDGRICHAFLENGTLRFLEDSTHCFAGQTVPLPELPDWAKKL